MSQRAKLTQRIPSPIQAKYREYSHIEIVRRYLSGYRVRSNDCSARIWISV